MQASDIPVKIPLPFATNAGASYKRTIAQTTATSGRASFDQGFPPECFVPAAAGGFPPDGRDMNGLLLDITQWLNWTQAGGQVSYDSAFSTAVGGYPAGAVLQSTGSNTIFWISTVNNNTSNPDAGGANWLSFGSTSTSNLIIKRDGTASGANLTITGDAGQNRAVNFDTAGVLRYNIIINTETESGANAGSNAVETVYSDAGAVLWTVSKTSRATGIKTFFQSPTVPNLASGNSSTAAANTAYVDNSPFGYNIALHTGGHVIGTTYTNTTGKTKYVMASCKSSVNGANIDAVVNGTTIPGMGQQLAGSLMWVGTFVPPGATYSIILDAGSASATTWSEWF